MERERCACGSGIPFERCHGDPANPFAREQALGEARDVAMLFPSVRIRSPHWLERAREIALGLGDRDDAPFEVVDELAETLDRAEARRVVDEWVAIYPDRWASLTHAADDVAAAERRLVQGAVAAAIHERMSTPAAVIREIEAERPPVVVALTAVVPPPFLWSYDEARAAAAALPWLLPEVSCALVRMEHVERLRSLARLVRLELPFGGFPHATELLQTACGRVEEDVPFAREVLSLALEAYARDTAPAMIGSPN